MNNNDNLKINVKYQDKIEVAKYKNYELAKLIKNDGQNPIIKYYLIEYNDSPIDDIDIYYNLSRTKFNKLKGIVDSSVIDEIEKGIRKATSIELYYKSKYLTQFNNQNKI